METMLTREVYIRRLNRFGDRIHDSWHIVFDMDKFVRSLHDQCGKNREKGDEAEMHDFHVIGKTEYLRMRRVGV